MQGQYEKSVLLLFKFRLICRGTEIVPTILAGATDMRFLRRVSLNNEKK